MAGPVILEFSDIYALDGLYRLADEEGKALRPTFPAVYMWGWCGEAGDFHPYYVGQTTDIYKRTWEHIRNLRGGAYTIFTREYLTSGRYSNTADNQEHHKTQRIYVPSSLFQMKRFFDGEVQKNVSWLVEHFRIAWADTTLYAEQNRELEKYIANRLGTHKIGATVKGRSRLAVGEVTIKGNPRIVSLLTNN